MTRWLASLGLGLALATLAPAAESPQAERVQEALFEREARGRATRSAI